MYALLGRQNTHENLIHNQIISHYRTRRSATAEIARDADDAGFSVDNVRYYA